MTEIRELSPADLAIMEHLYGEYSPTILTESIRLKDALGRFPSAGAFEGGEIVGFTYCFRFAPDVLELANIYVSSRHRGRGLGARLLTAIDQQAQTSGHGAVVAVNSDLAVTLVPKHRPDGLYLANGYVRHPVTANSTIFVKSYAGRAYD